MPKSSQTKALSATWVLVTGAIFGGLTLLFVMALVLLGIFRYEVPCTSANLVIIVVSLGAALATAFLGGNASARGALPIPGLQDQPLVVSVGGGVAVLAIMLTLLVTVFPRADCDVRSDDDDAKFFSAVAHVPAEQRISLYALYCNCEASPSIREFITNLQLSPSSDPGASEDIVQQLASAETSGDVRAVLAENDFAACGGEFAFRVVGGLLECENGQAIPYYASPNVGSGLPPQQLIIIDATASSSLAATVDWFLKPEAQSSTHLLASRSGAIIQLVPFDRPAWHAGKSQWGNLVGLNRHAVGIEFVNLAQLAKTDAGIVSWTGRPIPSGDVVEVGTPEGPTYFEGYTRLQVDAAKGAILALYEYFGRSVPVVSQSDVSPGRKLGVGPAFPFRPFCEGIDCPTLNENAPVAPGRSSRPAALQTSLLPPVMRL